MSGIEFDIIHYSRFDTINGNEKQLFKAVSGMISEKDGFIEAICIIDEKLFPLKS